MGNDASVDAPFERLCGREPIQYGDMFWDVVRPMPIDLEHDPADVEMFLRRWCEAMARNNHHSRNLNTLMEVVIGRLGDFRQDADLFFDDGRTTSLLNLLFLCRLFLKYVVERHTKDVGEMFSDDVTVPSPYHSAQQEQQEEQQHDGGDTSSVTINIPPSSSSSAVDDRDPTSASNSQPSPTNRGSAITKSSTASSSSSSSHVPLTIRFPRSIFDAIIALPLDSRSWEIHLELMYILMTMCSTQMYQPLFEPNPFVDMLTHRLVSCRAERLMQVLAKRMFERLKSPEALSHHQPDQGPLAQIQGVLASLVYLPFRIFQYFFPSQPKEFPVADHCALALLILSHQRFISQKVPRVGALDDKEAQSRPPAADEEEEEAATAPTSSPSPYSDDRPPTGLDGLAAIRPAGDSSSGQFAAATEVASATANGGVDHRRNSAAAATEGEGLSASGSAESLVLEFVPNPFQQALESLLDQEYHQGGDSAHRISFAKMFDCITSCVSYKIRGPMQKCSREWGILVLYTFLHRNAHFKDYLFSRSDIDELVVPLLRKLYDEHDLSSNSAYMLLIVLLILSEDASFCESIFKRLPHMNVPWFRESILNNVSVGSVAFAVILRTMTLNLTSNRDNYLHQNCSAVLANLSPFAFHLHSYPSQRLVDVTALLSKRYLKLHSLFQRQTQSSKLSDAAASLAHSSPHEVAESNGGSQNSHFVDVEMKMNASPMNGDELLQVDSGNGAAAQSPEDKRFDGEANSAELSPRTPTDSSATSPHSQQQRPLVDQTDVDTLAQFVFLLLRVISNCLSPRNGLLASNSNLVYCVRHGNHILGSLKSHDLPEQLWEAIESLQHIIDYFDKAIEDAELVDLSYERVLEVIRLSSRQYQAPFAHADDEPLRNCYDYAESDDSCEFFLPYTWQVVFETGGLAWDPRNIRLFDPKVDAFEDDEELYDEYEDPAAAAADDAEGEQPPPSEHVKGTEHNTHNANGGISDAPPNSAHHDVPPNSAHHDASPNSVQVSVQIE